MLLTPNTPNLGQLFEEKVVSLPTYIFEALAKPSVTDLVSKAMALAGVPEESRKKFNLLFLQIFTGDVPLKEFGGLLQKWTGIDEKAAFRVTQHLYENFIKDYREYLTNKFGPNYFLASDVELNRKPNATTPKLDGNIVNLKNV